MNLQKLLPAAALVTMLVGAGAMVATAQSVSDAAGTDGSVLTQVRDGGHGFGHGPGGRNGGFMRELFQKADANADGALTQEEVDAFRTAQFTAADTSGDGQVSLQEFEPAWTAFMQPRIVDAFQMLDDDGNGQITEDELAHLNGIVTRLDSNGDGALSPADRQGRGGHRHGG